MTIHKRMKKIILVAFAAFISSVSNVSAAVSTAKFEQTPKFSEDSENHSVLNMTTDRAVGKKITLGIKATGKVSLTGLKGVYEDNKMVEYEILSQNFSIAGDVVSLICMGGEITSIDAKEMPGLAILLCGSNKLTSLDLAQNMAMTRLWCENNLIAELKIGSKIIDNLACQMNKITHLDLTGQPELQQLMAGDNPGIVLDFAKECKLMALDCSNAGLEKLDLTGCPQLQELSCPNNKLTSLDLSGNPMLGILDCSRNSLVEVNLQNCVDLGSIDCSFNHLETLDLTHSENITEVYCQNNKLKKLDISANTSIGSLACDNNELEELTIGSNKLSAVWCYTNKLDNEDFQSVVTALNQRETKRKGYLYAVDKKSTGEKNTCIPAVVEQAIAKNWKMLDYDGGSNNGAGIDYKGEIPSGMNPLGNGCVTIISTNGKFACTPASSHIVKVYNESGAWVVNDNLSSGTYIVEVQTPARRMVMKAFVK